MEAPDHDENEEQEEEAEDGVVFVVLAELGPGEGACSTDAGIELGDGGLFGRGEAGKEERYGLGVGVEGGAVVAAEFEFFAAHDEGVNEGEIGEEENGGAPGVHGDGGAQGQDAAAEVERVAGIGVWAGGGEDFLLVEVAGGVGANDEADQTNAGTEKNGARDWTREIEHDDGKQVADADTPAGEEIEGGHAEALWKKWRVASSPSASLRTSE